MNLSPSINQLRIVYQEQDYARLLKENYRLEKENKELKSKLVKYNSISRIKKNKK